MKRVKMFVMANFILPLHGQGLSESKPPPRKINSEEAMNYIGSSAKQDVAVINTTDTKKKPKASKEDEALFNELVNSESEKAKKNLNTQVLNEMLAKGQKDNLSLLLVKNSSDCNMVLEIEGKSSYKLPIPANGQNAMLLPKEIYQLKGNVCELRYEAQKDLHKNILVSLKRIED